MKVLALVTRLSTQERRTIGIAAAIVAGAGLVTRGVPAAVRGATTVQSRTELATRAVARVREAIAFDPVARESLQARAGRLVGLAPRLLDGATAAEASASLAGLVGGSATVRRVRIVRQDPRPDSIASVFRRVALRVEAEGDIAGIAGWIADLEEGPKRMRIRSLSLTAAEPGSPATQSERLRAELVVEAWASLPGSR